MRQHFYWPHRESSVYTLVQERSSCAQSNFQGTYEPNLRFFPAAGLLEFIGFEILGMLPWNLDGNQDLSIITLIFSKVTGAILTAKIYLTKTATIFLQIWVISHGIL